jgi:hypothetical protein
MAEQAAGKQPLDDLMLAMDVVDTLRHQQILIEREFNSEDRDRKLMQRLREIYASQGIEVPDHVLEQGVAALKEDRFAYSPAPPSLQTRLAGLYINRGSWGKPVLLVVGGLLLVWLAYTAIIRLPAEREMAALPDELQAQHAALLDEAKDDEAARARVESLYREGRSALTRDDREGAAAALQKMAALQEALAREYELRIVSRPGERSGVWRIPAANPGARNYYIIVEAFTPDGRRLTLPVVSEEDGQTHEVSKWGLRVDRAVFERIAADKQDDGIIQENRFGVKRRGYLEPEYLVPTTGAAITDW